MNFRFLYKLAIPFLSLASGFVLSVSAQAADEPVNCYQFKMQDNPVGGPQENQQRTETWCYQHLAQPVGSTYIYNADDSQVKPELAMVLAGDGILTHGSLRSGEVSIHRVQVAEFNPYSIPMQEPRDQQPDRSVDLLKLAPSAQSTLKMLLDDSRVVENLALPIGHSESFVPTGSLPWRGYWWAYRGQPMFSGSQSPLGLYDRFVTARSGINPGASRWESIYHNDPSVGWYGHCNGWAAASILRAEPKTTKRDPQSGLSFDVITQKGILTEKDYCVSNAFYGRRNNGRPGDDPKDIYPANFHRVITYYLGNLKKPVVIEYKSDPPIDNHVVSGYWMDIQRTAPGQYIVTTQLRVHQYDGFRTNTPGIAPSYLRTYRYTLTEDASGNLVGGQWLSANPDFLWVPLSPARCVRSGNPQVLESWVQSILGFPGL